ncbi:MerR family transcriptional regulator [Nocardia sp. NPDC051990]|uniref:MerR family transcriptional regulator n=1 Tax=Nocardia sp. NPDC051990 TaxID=3155285 RepID=UPI00341D35A0
MPDYWIDDLARAAGNTTRNVRAYQERGLLPPPVGKDGRASVYDDSHLERLRLIDALLQRGFTTAI